MAKHTPATPLRRIGVFVNLYPLAAVLLCIFLWGLIIAAVRYFL